MKTFALTFGLALALSAAGAEDQPLPPASLVPPAATLAPPATNTSAPQIQFESLVHDFGRILAGATVRHDFVFTNAGDAELDVSNVAASCGCTTAGQWSRKVAPGQTGTIPIQFSSGRFSGMIFKTITITCNDPKQPTQLLQIKGNIWKPVEVSPEFAVLNANTETVGQARASIRILNREETPLTLSPPESLNRLFAVEVRTNQPGSDYELVVSVAPPAPVGNSQGVITLKTSSSNAPVVNVTALLVLQAAVMAMPVQINLPPPPLPANQLVALSIINNGTNALVLSDPRVSAKDVSVAIKETAPGRYFNLTLTFPSGFELPPGQPAEFTVKSSHPQFPVLKVPIAQAARRLASPKMSGQSPAAAPVPVPVSTRPVAKPPVTSQRVLTPPPLPPPLPGT